MAAIWKLNSSTVFVPAANDSFLLFSADSFLGSFDNVTIVGLPPDLMHILEIQGENLYLREPGSNVRGRLQQRWQLGLLLMWTL